MVRAGVATAGEAAGEPEWFLGDTAVRAGFGVSRSIVIVFLRNTRACSTGFEVSGDYQVDAGLGIKLSVIFSNSEQICSQTLFLG